MPAYSRISMGCLTRVRVPSLPLFTPRFCGAFVSPLLEGGREGVFRPDGDDAAVVEPDSLEDELEKLTLGFRHRILDETLKARTSVGGATPLEVEVFVEQLKRVLVGVAGDRLPLPSGE